MIILDSSFINNKALLTEKNSLGGAIYIHSQNAHQVDISIRKTKFTGNIAGIAGGAIYFEEFVGNI